MHIHTYLQMYTQVRTDTYVCTFIAIHTYVDVYVYTNVYCLSLMVCSLALAALLANRQFVVAYIIPYKHTLTPLFPPLDQLNAWSAPAEVALLTRTAYLKVLSQHMVSLRSCHSINMVS